MLVPLLPFSLLSSLFSTSTTNVLAMRTVFPVLFSSVGLYSSLGSPSSSAPEPIIEYQWPCREKADIPFVRVIFAFLRIPRFLFLPLSRFHVAIISDDFYSGIVRSNWVVGHLVLSLAASRVLPL